MDVHPGVICDGCDNSIHGFRYKCIQCHDFDLCRHCEGVMMHEKHLMVRIPAGKLEDIPKKIDRVLTLGRVFEKADEQVKKFRREEEKWRKEGKKFEEKLRREEDKRDRKEEKCKRRHHRRR